MKPVLAALIASLLILAGCVSDVDTYPDEPDVESSAELCNGLTILCDRTYDNVTFPETHNAFATHEDGIYYPASNHATGLQSQWDAGMRAFMLDTHYATQMDESPDEVRFCHGGNSLGFSPCHYGSVLPEEWLGLLHTEMLEHDGDVVTLLIENHVQAEHLKQVLNASLPYDWWYIHEMDAPWPTLAELIGDGTRLVIFWEQGEDSAHPYFHDFLTHSWTTDYAEENTEDMDCEPYRGDESQEVFHMNSWLRGPLGLSDPNRAEQANDPDFLVERALECIEMHSKRPTFLAVDWWGDGDVVEAAKRVNLLDLTF